MLIVGAGISGIGAAWHLQHHCASKSFVVLESLADFGGTWRTHRYPGIRSDSDLFTFGYGFKPWTGPPIASGAEILKYLGEVISENGIGPHIRYRHTIQRADWSSEARCWRIAANCRICRWMRRSLGWRRRRAIPCITATHASDARNNRCSRARIHDRD